MVRGASRKKKERRDANMSRKFAAMEATMGSLCLKKGKANRYFSLRGGMWLAAKRCMSNTSSYSLGLVLSTDMSGQTVRKWERRLRAAMIVSLRRWMHKCYQLLCSPFKMGGLRIAFHRIRADATNTMLWQKAKLHVLELLSVFVLEPILDNSK